MATLTARPAAPVVVSPVAAPVPTSPAGRPPAPSPWLLALPLGVVLALLPPRLSALFVVAIAGAAVVLARPRWALYFLAATVPYQSLVDIQYQGVSVSVTEAVVVLLLVAWATKLASGAARSPRFSGLLLAVGLLLLALVLSVLVASDLTLSAKELLKWLELAAAYAAGVSLLETRAHRRTMLLWLLGAGVSQALVGLVQSVARIGPPHFMIGGVLMRAYGTFEQPNPFGGYLGLLLPVAVSIYLFGLPPGRWRRVAGVVTGLIGLALLITLSRGAWTAQVVALLLVVMMASRPARHAVITFGLLGLLPLAGVWPLLPPELADRISSVVTAAVDLGGLRDTVVTPENWAVQERLSQWYAGWQMFVDNPILGIGIGNYNAAYDKYRLDQWPVALGHAHNHYLTIAAEAGFLGLLAYVWFIGVALRAAVRAYRAATDPLERAAALGILGSLAAFATHNMFDVLFVHGMGVLLGLLLAVAYAIHQGARHGEHTETEAAT